MVITNGSLEYDYGVTSSLDNIVDFRDIFTSYAEFNKCIIDENTFYTGLE